MKKLSKYRFKSLIGYSLVTGTVFCLLSTNHFFLSIIEKAVETRLNPFRIIAWLVVFLGS